MAFKSSPPVIILDRRTFLSSFHSHVAKLDFVCPASGLAEFGIHNGGLAFLSNQRVPPYAHSSARYDSEIFIDRISKNSGENPTPSRIDESGHRKSAFMVGILQNDCRQQGHGDLLWPLGPFPCVEITAVFKCTRYSVIQSSWNA